MLLRISVAHSQGDWHQGVDMLLRISVAHSQGDWHQGVDMLLQSPCFSAGTGSCSVSATMESVAACFELSLGPGVSGLVLGLSAFAPDTAAGAAVMLCTLLADTCDIPIRKSA